MSTAPTPKQKSAKRYGLGTSRYEHVASMLVALLLLIGTTVGVMIFVFLVRRYSPEIDQVTIIPRPLRRGDPPKGYADDIEPPGLETAPQDLPPQLQETLRELTNAISSKTAMLSTESFQAAEATGYGTGQGNKNYDGDGSGEGGNDPPKELRFEPTSDLDYAQMIDFFGAELAVADPKSKKWYYAKNLSQARPTVREGSHVDEKKLNRFNFLSSGILQSAEVRLARKAGIMKAGGIVLVFYPDEIANDIYTKEQAMMRKNGYDQLEDIDRTIFRVKKEGRTYVFSVEDQKYF
jgi:hypothetical protein